MVASIQGSRNIDGGNPVSGSKTGQWRKMWRRLISNSILVQFTVVFCKYAPPFATLALVQNAGGLYAGCDKNYGSIILRILGHNNKYHCFSGNHACQFPPTRQFFNNGHATVFSPKHAHFSCSVQPLVVPTGRKMVLLAIKSATVRESACNH